MCKCLFSLSVSLMTRLSKSVFLSPEFGVVVITPFPPIPSGHLLLDERSQNFLCHLFCVFVRIKERNRPIEPTFSILRNEKAKSPSLHWAPGSCPPECRPLLRTQGSLPESGANCRRNAYSFLSNPPSPPPRPPPKGHGRHALCSGPRPRAHGRRRFPHGSRPSARCALLKRLRRSVYNNLFVPCIFDDWKN